MVFALIKKPDNELAKSLNFFKDMYWAWSFSIYIAFALIIWLQTEMYFLQAVEVLHCFYMLLAMFIISIALLPQMRRIYEIKTR